MSDDLTIKTDGGTEFRVDKGQVTITARGHVILVPLADLREFLGLIDLEEDDDDFAGGEV